MPTKSRQTKKAITPAVTSRMAAFQAAKANLFARARSLKGMGVGGQQPLGNRRIGGVRKGTR